MVGPDFQKIGETRTAEAAAGLMTAFGIGAHEVDTVEPDGGDQAAAIEYPATVADSNI